VLARVAPRCDTTHRRVTERSEVRVCQSNTTTILYIRGVHIFRACLCILF